MPSDTHAHPDYMRIFWCLAVLTGLEVGATFLPIGKWAIGTLLVGMALSKAALVAAYFMHLKFERRTLSLIAVTPLCICALLVFMLLPDATWSWRPN
jgi:cytochrome c oxidase subunit 4